MGMTYQRGAVWWVKYYRNGRPTRESSGSTKESDAIQLLKIREGDIAHGLPVNPKLNRIRFDEAADDLKTEYAVNSRRSADELERRIRLHAYITGWRIPSEARPTSPLRRVVGEGSPAGCGSAQESYATSAYALSEAQTRGERKRQRVSLKLNAR